MFSTKDNSRMAYVIVVGNEKGGSGKTTTSMHITIALLNAGYKVATIDLDGRQRSFTRYLENRRNWSNRNGLGLLLPHHSAIDFSAKELRTDSEAADFSQFMDIVSQVEREYDFVVIDTPGHDGYLMQLSHSVADTLITPINDSYLDFDVLGHIDPGTAEVVELSHYATTVREARHRRRKADNGILDWVVVRNRVGSINSRNAESVMKSLSSLSMKLGCRVANGIAERVVFRELFPVGLTVLDDLNIYTVGQSATNSHLMARQEVRSLISALRLPIDELGKRRAQARKVWAENSAKPIDTMGLLAD